MLACWGAVGGCWCRRDIVTAAVSCRFLVPWCQVPISVAALNACFLRPKEAAILYVTYEWFQTAHNLDLAARTPGTNELFVSLRKNA